MKIIQKKFKESLLKDYKLAVGECLYYSYNSGFKDEKIKQIKQEYKIEFIEDFDKYIQQFDNIDFEDLNNIIEILNIESDGDYTNANRCEAIALTLGEILRKNLD